MPTLKPCSRLHYKKLPWLLQILVHFHRMKIHCNQLSTWFSATQMFALFSGVTICPPNWTKTCRMAETLIWQIKWICIVLKYHTFLELRSYCLFWFPSWWVGQSIRWQLGASLVAQWLRICLPMQGTWVRALVWEDPTCHGAAGPVSHNYWACASGACAPQREGPR